MATRQGDWALGLGALVGTIEVGKAADLVLLAANPLDDLGNTRLIRWVMKAGRRYDIDSLRATER